MPITNGGYFNVFAFDEVESGADVKLNEDSYEVFVNNQFVGHKTLLNQGDQLSDVDDFLKNQGITDFSTTVEGDHYIIQANTEDENSLQAALKVYFNNR